MTFFFGFLPAVNNRCGIDAVRRQISPLRCASVEMTTLVSVGRDEESKKQNIGDRIQNSVVDCNNGYFSRTFLSGAYFFCQAG